jgi:drug/metabolite transporter (DMT)-like permease
MAAAHRDNRLWAALLVCGACLLAAMQDAAVKWVSGTYPVHEILVVRCIAAFPALALIVHTFSGLKSLANPYWPRALLRGIVLFSGYLGFILSIAAMPIADSVAIYFTMPFIVAFLSWPLLGERVRPHRWIAIAVGFTGVIVMNGVTKGVFDPAVLFALWSAFGYGLGQVIGRGLSRHMPAPVMSFYQNGVYLAGAIVLAAAFRFVELGPDAHKSIQFLARHWAAPTLADFSIMAMLGLVAAFGMVMFSTAYKYAEASFVAPFEYSSMLWAVMFGLAIWGDFPDRWTALGAAIVVGAGLYMLWGDARISKMLASSA